MSEATVHPEVLWAQRSSSTDPAKNFVYLTLNVPDVSEADLKLDITPTKLTLTGKSVTKKTTYHVELDFFGEIVPEETKKNHTDRDVELVLRKKDLKEEYWPRLLKEKGKVHFLRTDFDKWVDEDEQDENPEDEDLMSKMGGMGGAGGAGGNGFEGIDFSKLGSGLGGDPSDLPEEDSDDDEDEMPDLEGEAEESAPASKKIEEVE
ncbi:HSP20-like chaperone [Venturia nashicola]|uniref:HSP20-like chaperone n=1 Tax=Venturia nashicola TaxID=86259 RepID=A0A4Z1PFE5_9PEZI|nr:HSP20-like chaperone [Venturia nashicola]TLD34740.1 HSP20-like chaperone [Venturia nashicola]